MSIEKLSQILKESNSIVFFGGAGISTESNNKFLYNNSPQKCFEIIKSAWKQTLLKYTYFIVNSWNYYITNFNYLTFSSLSLLILSNKLGIKVVLYPQIIIIK